MDSNPLGRRHSKRSGHRVDQAVLSIVTGELPEHDSAQVLIHDAVQLVGDRLGIVVADEGLLTRGIVSGHHGFESGLLVLNQPRRRW